MPILIRPSLLSPPPPPPLPISPPPPPPPLLPPTVMAVSTLPSLLRDAYSRSDATRREYTRLRSAGDWDAKNTDGAAGQSARKPAAATSVAPPPPPPPPPAAPSRRNSSSPTSRSMRRRRMTRRSTRMGHLTTGSEPATLLREEGWKYSARSVSMRRPGQSTSGNTRSTEMASGAAGSSGFSR